MGDTDLTKLGKEIILVDLVGLNPSYRVLRQPKHPAYPRGDEARYSDDYLKRINDLYPLMEVLGPNIDGIKAGNSSTLDRLTMGSKARSCEGEEILKRILYNCAVAGEWQPKTIDVRFLTDTVIKSAKEYVETISKISDDYNRGKIDKGLLFGIYKALRGGLVLLTTFENRVILLPSQIWIEDLVEKL